MDEIVINRALEAIAAGATKSETRDDIVRNTNFRKATIDELLATALDEALKQGVEREDIDPSWF